jgi:hypothetical protein
MQKKNFYVLNNHKHEFEYVYNTGYTKIHRGIDSS